MPGSMLILTWVGIIFVIFWLPLWYLVAIVLSVLLRITASDYLFGILWPLCCLFFLELRFLITSLVSCRHCVVCSSLNYGFWLPLWYLVAIVLSVLLWITASDYLFGILWPLCCLFFLELRLLITSFVSCGHCVVCSSLNYGFWLPLWYLQTFLTVYLHKNRKHNLLNNTTKLLSSWMKFV